MLNKDKNPDCPTKKEKRKKKKKRMSSLISTAFTMRGKYMSYTLNK
jgi:hypothetical protein